MLRNAAHALTIPIVVTLTLDAIPLYEDKAWWRTILGEPAQITGRSLS